MNALNRRALKAVAVVACLPLVLGACTLYSSNFGAASLDLAATWDVYFVIDHAESQALANIYFNNCSWNFTCYANLTVAGTADPIGEEALGDCNAVSDQCGNDEVAAIWDRAFTGGLQASNVNRCLGFGVQGSAESLLLYQEGGADFAYGSWGWGSPGWWTC